MLQFFAIYAQKSVTTQMAKMIKNVVQRWL